MPTVLSGWDWVLAPKMRLTASACAPKRVGVKSPFRVYSELSTLILLVCAGARKIHYHRRFENHFDEE